MYVIEALSMGRPVLCVRASGEKAARRHADAMRAAFTPRQGREIIVRGPDAPVAWWTARASSWQALGPIAGSASA
jgi:hypothetical protein